MPRIHSEEVPAGQPAWTTDLREMGFTVDALAPPGLSEATRQIAFGSNDELVVANADSSFSKPRAVHAFVLEARAGAVIGRANWMTKSWPYVFATAKGRYAVVTEGGLALYSSGLKEILATSVHSAKMASPDGRALAARKKVPGHGVTLLLDSEGLQPTGLEFRDHNVLSISQNRIAYTAYVKGSTKPAILIEGATGSTSVYQTQCPEVRPYFLSDEILAVFGCGRVEVIKPGGERLFSRETDGDSSFAGASRDGSKFAMVKAFYGSGHNPKLREERFTVFDARSLKPIFTTDIKDLHGRESGRSGAALSPDGSLLAVNSLGIVRLFHLPAHGSDGS